MDSKWDYLKLLSPVPYKSYQSPEKTQKRHRRKISQEVSCESPIWESSDELEAELEYNSECAATPDSLLSSDEIAPDTEEKKPTIETPEVVEVKANDVNKSDLNLSSGYQSLDSLDRLEQGDTSPDSRRLKLSPPAGSDFDELGYVLKVRSISPAPSNDRSEKTVSKTPTQENSDTSGISMSQEDVTRDSENLSKSFGLKDPGDNRDIFYTDYSRQNSTDDTVSAMNATDPAQLKQLNDELLSHFQSRMNGESQISEHEHIFQQYSKQEHSSPRPKSINITRNYDRSNHDPLVQVEEETVVPKKHNKSSDIEALFSALQDFGSGSWSDRVVDSSDNSENGANFDATFTPGMTFNEPEPSESNSGNDSDKITLVGFSSSRQTSVVEPNVDEEAIQPVQISKTKMELKFPDEPADSQPKHSPTGVQKRDSSRETHLADINSDPYKGLGEFVTGYEEERRSVIEEQRVLAKRQESWTSGTSDSEDPDLRSPREVDSSRVPQRQWEVTSPSSSVYAKYEPDDVARDLNENVDKESIGDLVARKKQWEVYMTEQQAELERQKALQKQNKQQSVRHWEVKKPVFKDLKMSESALEREMRIATEREAELKREKERIKSDVIQPQQSPSVQTNYHEMTEADRGSRMPQHENIIEREIRELREREADLKRESQMKYVRNNTDQKTGAFMGTEDERIAYEGEVEKEMKQLKNREQELARDRARLEMHNDNDIVPPPKSSSVQHSSPSPVSNGSQHKNSKYEIQPFEQRHSENMIMREMRELREREEELRSARRSRGQTDSTDSGVAKQSIIYNNASDVGSYNRDVGPYKGPPPPARRLSTDSQNSSRSGTTNSSRCTDSTTPSRGNVAPLQEDDTPRRVRYTQETVVEREKRLALEREVEYKRLSGQPIREPPKQVRMEVRKSSNTTMPRSQSVGDQSLKKFASSQLQSEIERDRLREMDLKREGKIRTISQERIGEPLKYSDRLSTPPVQNNNLDAKKSRSISLNSFPSTTSTSSSASASASDELVSNGAASPSAQIQGINVQPPIKKRVHNPAEHKIERELREMKEREAELSRQRKRLSVQEPGHTS